MLDGLTIMRGAFPRTVRLVSTARLRQSVLLDLVDENDLEALAEIEGATSQRLIAQTRGSARLAANELVHGVPHAGIINACFAYAKPQERNRFNGPERGAWYAALDTETCIDEVKYHLTAFLAAAGDFNAIVDYAEMFASFAGEFLDLRPAPGHKSLNPNPAIGYLEGNRLADAVRAKGPNGIIYPSVRHEGGTCFAILSPHAVQSVAQGDAYRLVWAGDSEPTVSRLSGVEDVFRDTDLQENGPY